MGSVLFGLIISKLFKVDIKSKGSGNLGSTNVLRTCGIWAGIVTFVWDSMKGWIAVFLSTLIYVNTGNLIEDLSKAGYIVFIAGLFAVIGHCCPLHYLYYLFKYRFNIGLASQFKGGKGAATSAGVLISLSPWVFIICFIIFWIVFLVSKYVSLSSMISIGVGFILILVPNINYFYMYEILGHGKIIIGYGNPIQEFTKPSISFSNNWLYLFVPFVLMFLDWALVVFKHKANIIRLMNGNENKMMQGKRKA